MLFERRAYTLRTGAETKFWGLQRQWNTPKTIPGYLQRCIGYFHTLAGPAEQVVHLYRYDSYDDWKSRLFGIYTPDRAEYFSEARKLLIAQENMFLNLAAIPHASPLWGEGRDWLPGEPAFNPAAAIDDIVAVETTIDLVPGGLPVFFETTRIFSDDADGRHGANSIACFSTLVGPQHRILQYTWYANAHEAERHQRGMAKSDRWREYRESIRPYVRGHQVSFLKVTPIVWMRPLFESVSWS